MQINLDRLPPLILAKRCVVGVRSLPPYFCFVPCVYHTRHDILNKLSAKVNSEGKVACVYGSQYSAMMKDDDDKILVGGVGYILLLLL